MLLSFWRRMLYAFFLSPSIALPPSYNDFPRISKREKLEFFPTDVNGINESIAPQLYPSYFYGADPPRLPKRQKAEFYPITGVHTGNGSVQIRMEIRELEKDPISWNLYLLGLDMMQNTPQSDKLSWYQIAGGFLSAGITQLG